MGLGIPSSNILGSGAKVEYLLSLEDPAVPGSRKTIALPFVNMFRQENRPSVQIRHTLGRAPIIEHSGTRKMIFTLQGRSGQHFFLGADADGNLKYASGVDLFQDLQRFMQNYENIASSAYLKRSGQNLASDLGRGFTLTKPYGKGRLLFLAPFENLSYYVQPTSFVVNRTANSSRHSYEFTLTLEATAEYVSPASEIGAFESVIQFSEKITKAIDTAAGAVAFARAQVDIFNNDLRRLLSPIDALARVVSEADALLSAGRSTLNVFATQTNKLLATIGQAVRVAYDTVDTISFNALDRATDQGINEVLAGLTQARNAVSAAFGHGFLLYDDEENEPKGSLAETVTVETSTTAAALVTKSPDPVGLSEQSVNFSYAKVLEGETLLQFAKRLNFDAKEIASLNGMVTFSVAAFNVPLTGGLVMKVPATTPVLSKPGDLDEFGTDLKLDLSTGDLVLKGSKPTDFFTISGPKNLEQGTTLRLLTVEGENSVFPSLGLPIRTGDASTTELVGSLAFDVRAQLLSDRRIAEITSLTLEDRGDELRLDIEAVANKETGVQFSVPI